MNKCMITENSKFKFLRSDVFNYNLDKRTGYMETWGRTKEEDPQFCPFGPVIADIEVTTICSGVNGTPCSFCFVSGTKINTKEGCKNIEDIKKGDIVSSYNVDLNVKTFNNVLEVYERDYNDLLIIIEDENNNIIKVTPNHPIFIKNKGWIEAQYVCEDDEIVTF